MFTRKARLSVIALLGLISCWTIYEQVFEVTVLALVVICLLCWGYLHEGTVLMAARALKAGRYQQAEILLQDIKEPNYLGKNRRGFYEFIYGSIELQHHNYEKAEQHFQAASKLKLRSSNDRAIVWVHLANINQRKQNTVQAEIYLQQAKKLNTSARVQQVIEKIYQALPARELLRVSE